jgi:HEAT repeat protein
MRAVEVSFIRDCAEMASRSSLTRTESRWGLYHDRSDLPERDDENWRYHLNLRKATDGSMEFLKRPVAPYFVPVPGLDDLPSGETEPIHVHQPALVGGQAPASEVSRVRDGAAAPPPSPRIAAVLSLESPTVEDLSAFLSDPDAGVRRTAVDVLTEHLPDEYGPALLAALDDGDAGVRATAADGMRELVEVLPDPAAARAFLGAADPVVRAAVVYLLSSRKVGETAQFRRRLDDPDHRVRIEAVRALVSVDDAEGVSAAQSDDNREVRIAVANALGTLGQGAPTIRILIADRDPLVRAAALAALGTGGVVDTDLTTVERALAESAWQVRQGAVRALAGVATAAAVAPLTRALSDPHLDVRKAAVLSLTRWAPSDGAARDALNTALDDGDADVRAYARQALATASVDR